MKTRFRKITAYLLTLCMLMTLLPAGTLTAFAAEETEHNHDEGVSVTCTCGTDDESIHATDCPAYVAPETAVCTCVEQCTEDNANVWCDVCGFDASACTGTDMAAAYTDSLTVTIGTGESVILYDTDGDSYYEIGTANELYAFAAAVNGGKPSINGKLTANIIVNTDISDSNTSRRAWTPIGNDPYMYTGIFDGDNKTISGLYYSNSSTYGVGLFGYLGYDDGATVKNVGVVNSYFSGNEMVGGVVGATFKGTVENCFSSASVSGPSYIGGVVGRNQSTVRNCYNTGSVSCTGSSVGGVVGYNDGTVENCYNTGSVSGTSYRVGGVVGCIDSGTIKNCYYLKDCATDGSGVAQQGIGAESKGSTTTDVAGSTTGYYDFSTGEVCYKLNGDQSKIVFKQTCGEGLPAFSGQQVYYGYTSCLEQVKVYTNEVASDELKHDWENGRCMNDCSTVHTPHTWSDGICSECHLTCEHSAGWANGVCNECGAAHDPHSFPEDSNGICVTCGGYEEPEHDENWVYQIANAGQLYWFADWVNGKDPSANAVLTDNIVVNTGVLDEYGNLVVNTSSFKDWTPIGNGSLSYSGTFDGQGHSISGLYFSNENTDYVGLFGYVLDGTVKNVGVVDSYFCGQNYVGGVVGYCETSYSGSVSVENCYNTGIVNGTWQIGGVVGCLYSDGEGSKASIENCYNTGKVNGGTNSYYVGGVVGQNHGYDSGTATVANCYNTGSVNGGTNSYYVGGVVGGNYEVNSGTVSITNCYYLTNCATDGDGKTQFGIGANTRDTATDDVAGSTTVKDEYTFKSGAVAYLLNGDDAGTDAGVWKQTLGDNGDASPNFTGKTVYQSGTGYTNHEHIWSYEDGDYDFQIYATCTAEGCTLTGRVTITLGALGGTYTGDAHTASVLADSSEFTVREDAISYTKDGTALSAGEVPIDAGKYTATLTLGEGTDAKTATVTYTIDKASLTITAATIKDKTYDGSTTAEISNVTLSGMKNNETLTLDTDYTATAFFDNANAGDDKTVNVTVTLKDTDTAKNYTLSSGSYSLTGQTISKASLTPTSGNLEVTNGRAGSYTFSLSNLLPTLGDGQTYGDVTYTLGTVTLNESYYDSDTASISGSILTLPIRAVESSTESEVGTIQITITSDNYTFTEATITVSAVNKEVPQGKPTLSKTTLTYGDNLSTITLSGSMTDTNGNPVTGTFTWENPDAVPTVATTSVTWKFTPDNSDAYAEVTGTANIVVNKAASSVSTAPTGDADLTYTGSGQNLLSDKGTAQGGEMQFSLEQNGNYSADIPTGTNAGDYTVWYKVVGDANHKDTAPLSLSVNIKGAAPVIGWQKDSDRKTYDGSAATLLALATVTLVNNETYAETTHGSLSYTWYTDANCTVKTGTMDNSGASGEGMAPVNAGTYYVKASLAAKGNYAAADSSALTYTIDKNTDITAPAPGVGYTIDYVNESITIASGYSVKSDFNTSSDATVNSGSISSYIGTAAAPGILYIQRAVDQNHVASAWAEISLSRPAAPTGLVMSAETIQGVTDAMEYSVDGGTTWTAVPAGQTQIIGLAGNTTVQVRFKATDSAFCSELITNPTCTAPTGLTATYGDLLSSVALTNPDGNTPGEWGWLNSADAVGDVGPQTHWATFKPTDDNYLTMRVQVTITVGKANSEVTAAPTAKTGLVYGGTAQELVNAGTATGGEMQYSLDGATWGTAIPTETNAGDYTVYYKVVGDSNHNDTTSASVTVTIAKADGNLTADSTSITKTFGDEAFDLLSALNKNGSDGALSYVSSNTNVVTVDAGGKATIVGAGSSTITVTMAEGTNHTADTLEINVQVNKADIASATVASIKDQLHTGSAITPEPTVTFNSKTLVKDTDYELAYSNNTNEGTATITITGKGNFEGSKDVTFKIATHSHVWSYKAEGNTITATCESTFGDCPVTNNTVTITLKAPTSLTYDGSEKVVTVEQSPAGVFSDVLDVAYTGDRTNVTADGFTATLTYGEQTAELTCKITTAEVTVTAHSKSKKFGEDNPALTYEVSGLIGGDTLSGALETTATKMSFVGEYDITIGDLANSNYTISYTGAKLSITRAASSVDIAPVAVPDLTYNGGEQDLITAGTADGGTIQYSLDNSTWSPAIPTGMNAGSYTVYYKVVSDINHEDTAVQSVSVTIAKKAITAVVSAGDKSYDGNTDAIVTATVDASDLEGTDSITITDLSGTFADANAGTGITVTVSGTPKYSGSGYDNYEIKIPQTTTANISKAQLTASINGSVTKPYDGNTSVPNDHQLSITLSGVLDADKAYVSAAANYAYDGADVGTTTIKATGITLEGDKAKNYELTATTASASAGTITKVESTFTPPDDIDTLVFNSSEQALITAGTAIGGEMQYALGTNNTAAPTEGWSTEIPTGKDAGNYYVWYKVVGDNNHEDNSGGSVVVIIDKAAAPTVTIDKQRFIRTIATWGNTINVAAMLPDDRGYTSCGDLKISGDEGIVSEDGTFLTPSGSLTFATMTSETVKSGKITFVFILANYDNTTIEVEVELFDKKTLDVTGVEALTELVYNGEGQIGYAGTPVAEGYDGEFAVTYSGRNGTTFEGDAENPPKNAGDYTVTLAIPDEDLYYKGQVSVDFTIGKAGLVIKADDKSAYRNASAPEYTYTVTGLIGEDTLTTAPTLTCDTDMKTNGTFDIVASGADAGNNYTIEYTKGTLTVSTRSSGGGSSTSTTTTKNDDGSTTKTTTNKATGTTTEVTTNTDGSTTTVETKKDGTVTTTEKDKEGNTTTTVENPDGSSTSTEKSKDGSETVIEKDTEGTTTTTEKDSEGNTTVTTEKADGTTTTEETKADGTKVLTETTASGKTTATISAKAETEVVIPVPDTDKVQMIVVTDEDGKDTYITDIKADENGVAVTTSGDATVSVISGDKKEFVDVHHVEHWSEESIDFVHALGLMNGTSENHFSPDEKLTRAMLVTVLYRAEGEPEIANDASFTDVESGSYYEKAVAWAKANGIVNGTTETTFAPNDNITREQIAAIMHRYADYKGHDVSVGENTNILSYDDAHHVSEYAIGAMQYAVGAGLIKGKTDSTLNPSDNATRAEAAAIIERYIKAN